jgi:signal transduction histidine kinase
MEREMGNVLCLILCKEIIEKHSGEIKVQSEEGKGSMFSFTLGQA